MRYELRVVCSEGAKHLTADERRAIALDVVKKAEDLHAKSDDALIFNAADLKVVVRWGQREVWIMTKDEALKGGLPSPSDN